MFYIRTFHPWSSDDAIDDDKRGDRDSKRAQKKKRRHTAAEHLSTNQLDEEHAGEDGLSPDTAAEGNRRRSPDKTFNEQVKLFNKAKAGLASGELKKALELLNRLKQRYPAGPLTLEAKELEAHVLARLKRFRKASQTVKSLIRAKIPTRKKAQLYRFLGDLEVKQNLCDSAVESYRRALGLGLSGAESQAAKAGIRKCVP